jgi:DNA-binding cell septation regulator SpoVG
MEINVCEIRPSRRDNVLAEATVEIDIVEPGVVESITIDDIRILSNRHAELWVAMPSFSVSLSADGIRRYEYRPTVTLSRQLQRELQDVVLAAFDQWQQDGGSQ